jgi:hypothetical protein
MTNNSDYTLHNEPTENTHQELRWRTQSIAIAPPENLSWLLKSEIGWYRRF